MKLVTFRCSRLGLTSLAYLWQRDQGELMNEMLDARLDAVIIKVAGIGLTGQHLGKRLSEMQSTLFKLVSTGNTVGFSQCTHVTSSTDSTDLTSAVKVANTKL